MVPVDIDIFLKTRMQLEINVVELNVNLGSNFTYRYFIRISHFGRHIPEDLVFNLYFFLSI